MDAQRNDDDPAGGERTTYEWLTGRKADDTTPEQGDVGEPGEAGQEPVGQLPSLRKRRKSEWRTSDGQPHAVKSSQLPGNPRLRATAVKLARQYGVPASALRVNDDGSIEFDAP